MKEFFKKGEKAAFLTRDLLFKNTQLQRLLREETSLRNQRLIMSTMNQVMQTADKIFQNIKVYDVNGQMTTIDFLSIEQ